MPWDQALDLILRINGLDYVLENNVLRVAPISKAGAGESPPKAAFAIEIGEGETAQDGAQAGLLLEGERHRGPALERQLPALVPRIGDRRRADEHPDPPRRRRPGRGILRLIESLDLPTPQVVIEGPHRRDHSTVLARARRELGLFRHHGCGAR